MRNQAGSRGPDPVCEFLLSFFPKLCLPPAIPTQYEGRTRRHERETGCGGRGGVARRAAFFRGRRSRVVLASRAFSEQSQWQIFAQIRRAGLGLSSTVFGGAACW